MYELTFYPVGDSAISAQFGTTIDPRTNQQIRHVLQSFNTDPVIGVLELVPTYCHLLIQYDPLQHDYASMCQIIRERVQQDIRTSESQLVRIVELPTAYGGDYGPDLGFVASHNALSEEDVIHIHAGTDYLVYMLGFIPGFTYLGGMDKRIATPRLSSPRTLIPAGSVGIAGSQTGTYPSDSPGGWQIIGRTPLVLYDGSKESPTLLQAGDYVRYVPIDVTEYIYIKAYIDDYEPIVHHCTEQEVRRNE